MPHAIQLPDKLPVTATNRWLASIKDRRKLWLEIHLWLGLVAGALLVIIGLTGSLLVYFKEIDGWLNPELLVVAAPKEGRAAYKPLAEIVAAARAAIPPEAQLGFVYYPRNEETAFWFFYQVKSAASPIPDSYNIFVNPYTVQVTGTRLNYSSDNPFKNCLTGFLFKLHYSLLLGMSGALIVGILCVLFIVSTLSGLILWWPITGKWKQSFLFKRQASIERFNHDLHKLSGFYMALVLLAVLISGVYFNLGAQFKWIVELFSPVTHLEKMQLPSHPQGEPVSIDKVIEIAKQHFPDGELFAFSLPPTAMLSPNIGGRPFPYTVSQLVPVGLGFIGRRNITLDQFTGEVLHVGDPLHGSGGDVFIQWQWPLHSGYFFGMTGRILVLISGIACAVLYITGVLRWLQKRRSKREAQDRHARHEEKINA